MEQVCLDLREGRASLDVFFRALGADLKRMADALHARWVLPPSVGAEDVYQQMVLSILEDRRDLDWIPGTRNKRGQLISILTHVLWHAHVAGKRWIHAQRGAKRRSGKARSEFPICISALIDEDDDLADFDMAGHVGTEAVAEGKDAALKVYDKLPTHQAVAWAVYVKEGDENRAARRISASTGLGVACHVGNEDEAREAVKQVVKTGRAMTRAMMA